MVGVQNSEGHVVTSAHRPGVAAATIAVACLTATVLSAQSEKVSVQITPRPNQNVRVTMTQEGDMAIKFDGSGALASPMNISTNMTLVLRIKTGAVTQDGNFDAELTYEQVNIEVAMNGQPLPVGDPDQLVGKTTVLTYNRDGEVVDAGSSDSRVPAESLKQMLTSLTGNLPKTPLGVGETVTAPFNFALPGLPLPAGMNLGGDVTVKLISIDKDALGRIARFESTTNSTIVSDLPSPDGKTKSSFELSMNGSGTSVKDLETGMLRTSESTNTIVGTIKTPAGSAPAPMPGMTLQGTLRMTFASGR